MKQYIKAGKVKKEVKEAIKRTAKILNVLEQEENENSIRSKDTKFD